MTRAYQRIMNKRENDLFVAVAHKVAKRIEIRADKVGYEIDHNKDWIDVHTLLLDYEFNNITLSALDRTYICEALERIAGQVGYNFWRGFIYYLETIEI